MDCKLGIGQTVPMAARNPLDDFDLRFLARTYAARKLKFETQQEIADDLGISQDHYKQFEVRSPLPHALVDRFLRLTGVTYEWLFAGRGAGPAWQGRYEDLIDRQRKPRRRQKAA